MTDLDRLTQRNTLLRNAVALLVQYILGNTEGCPDTAARAFALEVARRALRGPNWHEDTEARDTPENGTATALDSLGASGEAAR